MEFEKLQIGETYPGKIKNGAYLEYQDTFTLYLFLPNITDDEAKSINKGAFKFALTELSDVLFFLYEFKYKIKLSDVPFHFGLYRDNRAENLPREFDDPIGLGLNVIAVDSETGIVKGLRLIGLGTRFSNKLIEICREQSGKEIDRVEYHQKILDVQNRYHAKDLIKFSSNTFK